MLLLKLQQNSTHQTMTHEQNTIEHMTQNFAQSHRDVYCSIVSSFRYHSTSSRQTSWKEVKGEVQKCLKPKTTDSEGRLKEPRWTGGIKEVTEVRHHNLQTCKTELYRRQSNVLHIHYKDEVIGLNSNRGDLT